MSAVGADDKLGEDVALAGACFRVHTDHPLAIEAKSGHFGFHLQLKCRIDPRFSREKVKEVPLRHEREELAAHREVGEIAEGERGVADLSVQLTDFLVWQLQQIVEDAELVENFQRRRMDGIAAEVAEEISVLLQNLDANPGAGE